MNILKSVKSINDLALPQYFPLFAKGLGKPLSMASSGQSLNGLQYQPSPVQELLSIMEMNLLNSKAVLANEAFPKGSSRLDYFEHPG